jgi:hypothetical protein
MASVGVLVHFEAKPDKVDEVEALLRALVAQVNHQHRGLGKTSDGLVSGLASAAPWRSPHRATDGRVIFGALAPLGVDTSTDGDYEGRPP